MLESRLQKTKDGEKYVDGYFLTLDELTSLCIDVRNKKSLTTVKGFRAYISYYLEKH